MNQNLAGKVPWCINPLLVAPRTHRRLLGGWKNDLAWADWERIQLGNYAFAASAGHWFLEEVLEELIRRTSHVDLTNLADDDVLYVTGPDCVNATRIAQWDRLQGELTILEGDKNPRPPKPRAYGADPEWFQFGCYGNHVMTGSWRVTT